jgi:GntR family phosphonate transport system transcriptional regulator
MSEQVARRKGVSIWRQIQESLETEVIEALEPGDKLPTEQELAARFGVNRHTVRRALGALEEKGLVRIEQGRGTFVHERVLDYAVGKHTRFTQNLTRQSREPRGVFLGAQEVEADAKVAEALEIPVGTPVLRVTRAGHADGRPVTVADHYFPLPRFKGLEKQFEENASITESLAAMGVPDYTRKRTRILARMPSGVDADRLRQPKGRPVLITEGVNVDSEGRPVDFGVTRWASDWVQIVVED